MPINRVEANLVLNRAIEEALALEGIDEHLAVALLQLQGNLNVIPPDHRVTDAILLAFDQAIAPIQAFPNPASVNSRMALSRVRESASVVARGMLEAMLFASQQEAAPPPYYVPRPETSSSSQRQARPSSNLFFSASGASAAFADAAGEPLPPTYDEIAQVSPIAAAFTQPAEAAQPALSPERQRLLDELFDYVVDDRVEQSQAIVERDPSILLERIAFTDKLTGRRFGLDRHHPDFRDGFDVAEPISSLQYAVAVKAIDLPQRTDMCRMMLESLVRAPNVRELLPRVCEQIATENLPWQSDGDIQRLIQAYRNYLAVYEGARGHRNWREELTLPWQAVGQAQRLLPMSYTKLYLGSDYPPSFKDVRANVKVAWRGASTQGLGEQGGGDPFSLASGRQAVRVGEYPPSRPALDYNALVRLHEEKTNWIRQQFIEPLRELATQPSVGEETALPPRYLPSA